MMKKLIRLAALLFIGGAIYFSTELLVRGRSHWSMFLCGGICFLLLGGINEVFDYDIPLSSQVLWGAAVITVIEFIFGCIFNLWLGLEVWDYSHLPGNVLGQICPQFTLLWIPVALVGIVTDDIIRWKLFGEERPHYRLFGWKYDKTKNHQ